MGKKKNKTEATNNIETTNNKKSKKPFYKKWWFWLIVIIIICSCASGNSDDDSDEEDVAISEDKETDGEDSNVNTDEEEVETHIYDNAEIRDVMTGSGDKKIGEFSLIEIDSSEVTMDALEDWYFNYVSVNDYNWCMILYTDYDDNTGVYANSAGVILVGITFAVEEENPEEYYIGNDENATTYYPNDDGTLIDSETFRELYVEDNGDEQAEETNE